MMDQPKQTVFYKYRPISTNAAKRRVKDYFLKCRLWYSQPGCLNDPFDCVPCVTVGGKPDETQSKEFFRAIHEKTAVLSMSLNPLSVQQWSYYAEEHRGVCLGFHMDHVDSDEKHEVNYTKHRTEIPQDLLLSKKPTDRKKRIDLMTRSITTKAKAWEHEDEVRFLKTRKGAIDFPPSSLVTVYFGYRCREEDITYVEKLIARSECQPHMAIMYPSLDSFEMLFETEDDFDKLREIARSRV